MTVDQNRLDAISSRLREQALERRTDYEVAGQMLAMDWLSTLAPLRAVEAVALHAPAITSAAKLAAALDVDEAELNVALGVRHAFSPPITNWMAHSFARTVAETWRGIRDEVDPVN